MACEPLDSILVSIPLFDSKGSDHKKFYKFKTGRDNHVYAM